MPGTSHDLGLPLFCGELLIKCFSWVNKKIKKILGTNNLYYKVRSCLLTL